MSYRGYYLVGSNAKIYPLHVHSEKGVWDTFFTLVAARGPVEIIFSQKSHSIWNSHGAEQALSPICFMV